jgi:hypothetical protein
MSGNFWEKIHALFIRSTHMVHSGDMAAPGA